MHTKIVITYYLLDTIRDWGNFVGLGTFLHRRNTTSSVVTPFPTDGTCYRRLLQFDKFTSSANSFCLRASRLSLWQCWFLRHAIIFECFQADGEDVAPERVLYKLETVVGMHQIADDIGEVFFFPFPEDCTRMSTGVQEVLPDTAAAPLKVWLYYVDAVLVQVSC